MARHTNLDKLREMYDKHKNRGFSSSFWYPPEEENIIRILPPMEGKEVFYKETGSHRFGEDNFFWCPRLTEGKRCPICEETKRRYAADTELDTEIARKIKVNKKYIYNIVDRKAEDPTEVKQYITGPKVWEKVLSYYFDEEYGALDDVEKGYDFKLIRKKQGDYPNYDDSRPMKNPSALSDDNEEIAEILSNVKDLDTLVSFKEPDVMKEALEQFLEEYYGEDNKATEAVSEKKPVVKEKSDTKKPQTKPKKKKEEAEPTPTMETEDDSDNIDEFEKKLMLELEDE